MNEIFRHTASRRLAVAVSLLLIVVCLTIYFFVSADLLPGIQLTCRALKSPTAAQLSSCQTQTALADISLELLRAIIVAATTSSFFVVVWSFTKDKEAVLDDVQVLDRPACKARHARALKDTDFWFHDGHLAAWVRQNVLPAFRQRSRGMASLEVSAAIIDPRNEYVCLAYLNHIKHLPAGEQHSKTINDLRLELCHSIIAFYLEHVESPYIAVSIFLKNKIEYIRHDVNADCAFMTVVGTDTPGIVINKRGDDSTFYNIIRTNYHANLGHHTKLDFVNCQTNIGEVSCDTKDRVHRILSHLLPGATFLDDAFSTDLLSRLKLV